MRQTMRRSGILMPVFSLPSKYGIGCFSKEAYVFVDFLEKAGQKLWQILPLGPTSYGDSPYQSFSTFAGNPYFINPDNTPSNCKPNHQSLMKNLLHIQQIAKANKKFNIKVM